MYYRYFNLEKKPFQLSSDNSFLWIGKRCAKTLADLKQGIDKNYRLMVLTGDVGTGKTTLLNEIVSTLPKDVLCAHITDPSQELHSLFLAIARDFGFKTQYREGESFAPVLLSFLQQADQQGKKAVIIIDEVQLIPQGFLAELLSWCQSFPPTCLSILLAGQLEFHAVMETALGRDWQDMPDVHARLEPLSKIQTRAYINHRLELAGAQHEIFSAPALHQAYIYSKGFPRRINIACDQAMIAAYSKDRTCIDASTFQEAVGILKLPDPLEPAPLPVPVKKESRLSQPRFKLGIWRFGSLAAILMLGVFTCYFTFISDLGSNDNLNKKEAGLFENGFTAPAGKFHVAGNNSKAASRQVTPGLEASGTQHHESHGVAQVADTLPVDSLGTTVPDQDNNTVEEFINELFVFTQSSALPLKSEPGLLPAAGADQNNTAKSVTDTSPARTTLGNSNDRAADVGAAPDTDAAIDWLIQRKRL